MPASHDDLGPYAGFEGRVGRTFAGSESWWPERPTPPDGAPNVIVMLADDLGYSDLGCFGGEIPTPNLDRLAERGLRYTNFHVTPMCSPTRAALLTGINAHAAGVGHVAHSDAGFPGYAMELSEHTSTLAEAFRDHGYATFMVGKWHLAKDSDLANAGRRHSWPVQRGFESFHGILDGFTNFHHPHRLVRDNTQVEVDQYPDDYYFTDDITDEAIQRIRSLKSSNPAKPFFCYFAHGAVHAPLQAKADDIARHAGNYAMGWDELRRRRHRRLIEQCIIADGTPLPPRNAEVAHDVVPWDELDPRQQELFARYMEVYAGMVDNIDQNVGRLVDALEELGELDNTIIIFTSDNGASREGEDWGTSSYYTHLMGEPEWEADHDRLDLIGGPQTMPHFPRGWAMACNTPFRLYKINTHAGGHQVPFIISWPDGIGDTGSMRRQYTFVTDLYPSLMEMCGIEAPTERNGRPLEPLTGSSITPTIEDPEAPPVHTEQYYEMVGHRGYYRDGWEIVTLHQGLTPFGDEEWELYDLTNDPTESTDLAGTHPEKVAELADAWERAAWDNQVYPLEEGTNLKHIYRPTWVERYERPVTLVPGTPTLERWRSQRLMWCRSFTCTVDLDFATGDEGVLVAHGDQGGGYVLSVEHDRLTFAHNDGHRMRRLDGGALAPGAVRIVLAATAPGGNVWDITLEVDGEERDGGEGFPLFLTMAPFEGIDVGLDRRSPVDWEIYERHGAFPWTGSLERVTYEPGPHAPDAPTQMIGMLEEMGTAFE